MLARLCALSHPNPWAALRAVRLDPRFPRNLAHFVFLGRHRAKNFSMRWLRGESSARLIRQMAFYTLTIFLSAFLLFQVQPLIA